MPPSPVELSIDTSTRYAGVALSREGEPLWEVRWQSRQNHTVELAPSVETVLARAGATPRDIRAVFIALGPGGFSALRVGMGLAKGLAESLGVPLAGVSTLEVEALPFTGLGRPVCPLLEVGRGQVAWAVFQDAAGGWQQLREERVEPAAEVIASAPPGSLFCGEGALGLSDLIRERLGAQAAVVAVPPPTRHLWALARLGSARLAAGEGGDRATVQPHYLRQPSITPPKAGG